VSIAPSSSDATSDDEENGLAVTLRKRGGTTDYRLRWVAIEPSTPVDARVSTRLDLKMCALLNIFNY